ncbi:MAG: nitronate monooxygenase [Anaerolineae bacterium]|nr:nitronate monooxygenase [Anaerolineae bacterium]
MKLPRLIQGGMGVAVSDWRLAKTVATQGQLGVVSGTGIALVMVARLQLGDAGGHVRRALSHFPYQEPAQHIIDKYYVEGGIPEGAPYKNMPMWKIDPPRHLVELTVIANFVEVWLAKEGHNNPVGLNLLEKVQMPNIFSFYGAMLGGLDVAIMGAGIPMQVPGILDRLADHQPVSYRLDVIDADKDDDIRIHFDPEAIFPGIAGRVGPLKRPLFFPIVSSVVLAKALLKRSSGELNGFVVEMPTAGGHNAPPRGNFEYDERGQPIYTEKDDVDFSKIAELGRPFWLAGSYGSPEGFRAALEAGAQGIQVGTLFAYSSESGMQASLKQTLIDKVRAGELEVLTDGRASPTGFPFKVVQLDTSIANPEVYAARERICDIGYLRHLYKKENGFIGYRCPSEPVDHYIEKGGKLEDTVGRKCICNHLGAKAGFAQRRKNGYLETPIVTSGDAFERLPVFLGDRRSYSAREVIEYLFSGVNDLLPEDERVYPAGEPSNGKGAEPVIEAPEAVTA